MSSGRTYPRRGLHGEVVHLIGLGILRGDLRPGELLPNEDQLSSELAVSRTVLREAVKVLTAKGLVKSRPKTGTRVQERTEWNLLDPDVLAWRIEAGPDSDFLVEIFFVRRLLEPATARLAAERATDAEIAELERCFRGMEESVVSPEAYVAADLQFHTGIYQACHNELLERIGETLRAAYQASFAFTLRRPGSSVAALPLHGHVLEAMVARDGGAAERAMLALLDWTADSYLLPRP